MSYTVLARRYRSEGFDDVVGQEAISKTLKNAIETDRVAHAYLFTGTRGVGKTTMARVLSKALNCLDAKEPTVKPCGTCNSCKAIAQGSDLDVIEIDAASHTGVDHIRELLQNTIYRPARARFKIYIIDEVHMLSVNAFNALLKTLEEPPEHVKFILATTEAGKILPTILSRCQRFDFRNIQIDDIAGQIEFVLKGENRTAEPALIRRVARLARGSMRDALSLLDQLLSMSEGELTLALLNDLVGTPRSEHIIDLAEAIADHDLASALQQVDQALSDGLTLEQITQTLQDHFRDLMILRNCGQESNLVDLDEGKFRDLMLAQSQRLEDGALVYNITVMEELRRAVKSAGAGRALLEAAIVRLASGDHFTDTQALLEQLQSLQTTAPAQSTSPAGAPKQPAPKASAAPTPPTATPDRNENAMSVPDNLQLDFFQEQWGNIVSLISNANAKHLEPCLKSAQPTAWKANTLILAYATGDQGMYDFLEAHPEKLAEIEKALAAIVSKPLKCKLALGEAAAETANGSKAKPSPGAKPSQTEIRSAMTDPLVTQVQKVLGGKVKHVRRLEN